MKIRYLVWICLLFYSSILNAKDLQNISVQLLWKHQFEFAGFYMAKYKGFYKDVGLKVKLKEYQNGIDITKDIEKGKSTFGVSYPKIVLDRSNGAKVVLLNAIFQSSPQVLVTLKSSGINKIKDFKNKRIMIDKDAIKTAQILSMLYSKNIKLSYMKIIEPSFNIEDLIDGKTDISSVYISNELYKLDNLGIKYNIFDPKEYGFDFYSDILFTSEKFTKNHPQIVNDFQKATIKGWNYAFSHIDETIKVIEKKYNTQHKSKRALLYEANTLKKLAYIDNIPFGTINKSKIQRIYDIYNLMGLVKNNISLKEFVYQRNKDTVLSKKEKQYLKNHKIIRMCNNPNWEPIEFVQDGVPKGIAIDTLHILEDKLNIKFEHIFTKNWVQSQKYLKEGKCDILPAAIKTSKRLKYANFTDPYLDYKLAIITKDNQPLINSIDDIIDKPISRKRGSGLITKLKNKYLNVKIIETDGYLESLHKVAINKAYSTIATLPVASFYINKFSLNNLYIAGYTKMRYKLSIAVSKDNTILLSILDKSLKIITKKQSKKIYNKWVNVTIKQSGFNTEIVLNILVVILVIVIFIVYRQYLLRKNNKQLKVIVDEKTKELQEINKNLELKIDKAVNEIRKKDKILYDQAKMASMGEMIGNIAHQWRQPLSVISTVASGNLAKIEYDMFNMDRLKKDLQSIMQSTEYLSSTIDDFKNFLKPNKNLVEFKISNIIQKDISMFGKNFLSKGIEIIDDLDDSLLVKGSPNELLQVIINIVNNAKDILVETNIDKKYIIIKTYKQNDKIIITIQDNAGGIPDEIISRVFEAYFTTKHKSQGTGLGLYMSYQIIINKFKGNLEVVNEKFTYEDKEYYGAKFIISLNIS